MWVSGYCTVGMEVQAPCMDSKNILVGVERHLLPGWDKSLSSLLGLFWHHLGRWVGALLQPHEGRSPGSPLSLCWHGYGWSHSYPMGFSRSRMVIIYEFLSSYAAAFLAFWKARAFLGFSFFWRFFCLCSLTFSGYWCLQIQFEDKWGKSKIQGTHYHVIPRSLVNLPSLPFRVLLYLFSLYCLWYLVGKIETSISIPSFWKQKSHLLHSNLLL